MYPNLYYLFQSLFGVSIAPLKVVNSFGFFVALSFLAAAWIFTKELKRKQAAGLLSYAEQKMTVGSPATMSELVTHFLLGFLFGGKLLGTFIGAATQDNFDPQGYIFSLQFNIGLGVLVGAIFTYLRWAEKNKKKLAKPEERIIRIWPADRVGDITIIAAVAGFAGAKVFDNLENWDRFIQDPIGNLFSASGLTFYGGLICAAVAIAYYIRQYRMPFLHTADAVAPGLMLAYGLGRVGCQVSGDGDWGIYNSAYAVSTDGAIAKNADWASQLQQHHGYLIQQYGTLDKVPHASFSGPSWLPDWLFAYNYPHNVNKEGVPLANCGWDDYCNHLPIPVFPTPLYEILMGLALFGLLWYLRKRIQLAGRIFAIYMMVNGLERFFIEKIRVNTTYNWGSLQPTQAEIIATALFVGGIILYVMAPKWQPKKPEPLLAK
ncbi:MAG TPA: diacylglyceryl transferase [Chitinophagaceae bacterium]|nr:diacylglyceryl transferase [Chitinophagaceae bacterium]